LLAARGLRPKKRLGQHFLVDGGAARKIASLCVLEAGTWVVEIGAGTGTLTRALLEAGARLRALEIDPDLIEVLRDRADLARAEIVEADALTYDFDTATRGKAWTGAGNLPYNIATPLVLRWLEGAKPPQRLVVMIQRDVAERFTATPGTAAYGSLSVAVQFAMRPKRAFTLGPSAFYPRPKVESAVVVMERRERPPVECRDRTFFFRVVRGAFAYRRKTLANSLALALGIPRDRVLNALSDLQLSADVRGERLGLAAFAALANRLLNAAQ
jgi:16S rRNA (adenine1518-N6/adenine1519-N6)-dimethyltransferase